MKRIVMHDTACGPEANFQSGQKYEVGKHISKEQAADFVAGRHASYETADGKLEKVETTSNNPPGNPPGGGDAVQELLDGFPGKIKAGLEALSDADLKRAGEIENAESGKKRPWVGKLVESIIEARKKPA